MASLVEQRANAVRSLADHGLAVKPNEREKQLNLWNSGLDKEDQQQATRRAEKQVQQQEKRLNLQLRPNLHRDSANETATKEPSQTQKSMTKKGRMNGRRWNMEKVKKVEKMEEMEKMEKMEESLQLRL